MRVAKDVDQLEIGGALEAHESTIKLSRKTFRMQIDSIYSDKIGAAPRELTSNAFDSHRRAKQDRPFYVHCPNALDPRFYVRDFGTGMSDDLMKNVYIVIGESDKEDTDDEVGKWGLGSKSPFAYADQYTISCFDGERVRHYGYGINDRGVPTLYLMQIDPSTEPRGVQVGFAVESKDYDAFKKAIERVSLAYETPFESNINLPKVGVVAFQGAGWTAYRESSEHLGRNNLSRWYARQGCVLYPIDAKHVTLPQENYQSTLSYILDCPIGTIAVTPSRESIEYDDAVTEYLRARVKAVTEEVKDAVWESVKDIKSVSEFFAAIEKIKPPYVSGPFEHPVTGLTEAGIAATWPTIFFQANFSLHTRWEFATERALNLSTFKRNTIYLLDDVSPLLDPSRDASSGGSLSRSEQRRISRFVRSYLEQNEIKDALMIMNAGWTDEFREACFPNVQFIPVSFGHLREAVPRRVSPPTGEVKPPIRGLAMAKAAGEQKPVFEIKNDGATAWVSSEQYRRQSSALFKVAKKFKVAALYIAAPGAQAQITEAQIPHLKEAIDAGLEEHGVTFADWYFAKEKLSSHTIKDYVSFLQRLVKTAPGAYTKLAAGKGEFSTIAKAVRRLLKVIDVAPLADDEKKAIESLTLDDAGKVIPPPSPADMVEFDRAVKVIQDQAYTHPTVQFGKSPANSTSKDVLVRYSQALLAVQALLPPSEKLKG